MNAGSHVRVRRAASTWALGAIVSCLLPSCGRDQPTAPQSHAMTGHVVLRGFLVAADGRFAGTRVVGDADGVLVELLSGTQVIAQAKTSHGVYRFEGIGPGAYIVRAPVIGDLSFKTGVLTIAQTDLNVADTLHLTSRGDIYPVPNPFGAATLGYFELPDTELVEGRILDLAGTSVRRLITAELPTGLWQMLWDGRDDGGHAVSGAVYWMTLTEPSGARGQLVFRDPGLPAPNGSAGPVGGQRLLAERSKMARAALTASGRSAQLLSCAPKIADDGPEDVTAARAHRALRQRR